jgi:hypothetical protein
MERMKRVLLLVCLIVSVVELDWERYQIYLWSSIASLLFVLSSELMRRRRVRQVTAVRALAGEGVPSKAYVAGSTNTEDQADYVESARPISATIGDVATSATSRADHSERSRILGCA